MENEIDPVKYGVLWERVQNMDKKIDKMEVQIGELLDQLRAHKKRLFGDQIEGPFSELIAELEA